MLRRFIPSLALIGSIFLAACGERRSFTQFTEDGSTNAFQYIVGFNEQSLKTLSEEAGYQGSSKTLVRALADDLAATSGRKPLRVFSTSISAGVFKMSAQQAKSLRGHPLIQFVEKDREVHLSAVQSGAPWNLDRIDQESLPLDTEFEIPLNPTEVHAYVIDTGVRISHEEFEGRARHGFDFVDDDSDATDCNGHGTHVAGTLAGANYGVAKTATVIGVRVLDCFGSGNFSDVIAGIEWVTENHIAPAVANMSLGGPVSQAIDLAVQASIDSGVTYVVAAGNSNVSACNSSPARVDDVISVGASTRNDSRSSFSNFGACVDIFAPGSDITSSWIDSNSSLNTIDGTSMASPLVAGVAAAYLAMNPTARPEQVKADIIAGGRTGVLSQVGTSSPNILLSSQFLLMEPGSGDSEDGDGVREKDLLESGEPQLQLSGERSDESRFRISVSEGNRRLVIKISGGSGDGDLYVRYGQSPNLSRFDCRPYRSTSTERCEFLNPRPGTYHIMLRAFRDYSGVELLATIE